MSRVNRTKVKALHFTMTAKVDADFLARVEAWRWANQIGSLAAAMRRLMEIGLAQGAERREGDR